MNQSRANRLATLRRTCCVFAGALAVWFAASASAEAGVIIATDAAVGGMSPPQSPAVPEPVKPLIRHLGEASLLFGSTNSTGGAGSQAPTFGPGSGLVAVVSESVATAQNTLISRLSLFSRICLPSPLQDRFFRPPRV